MGRQGSSTGIRRAISTGFTWLQDIIYISLAILLSLSAIAVLVNGGVDLIRAVMASMSTIAIITLLDRVLLALMIVELLYTVQISFQEHTLVPEPFVLVALIGAIRRILVITAEFGAQTKPLGIELPQVLLELVTLTGLIIVLVGSFVVLHSKTRSHSVIHAP